MTPSPVAQAVSVVVAVALVVAVARVLGGVFRRLGQPRVVGEMVAGLALGPTVLGGSPGRGPGDPGVGVVGAIFPTPANAVLAEIGAVSLVLFMFFVGLELPQPQLREQAVRIVVIGVVVVAAAVGIGCAVAALLDAPGTWRVVVSSDGSPVSWAAHALVVGGGVAATALPVVAAILRERGLLRSPVGILGVGVCAVVTPLTFLVVDAAIAIGNPGL